jgi:hypothetical protein
MNASQIEKNATALVENLNKEEFIFDLLQAYGINSRDKTEEGKMKAFLNKHADSNINKAVVMYMVSALQYFKPLQKDNVKSLAFESATIGLAGINPNKENYSIPAIKD